MKPVCLGCSGVAVGAASTLLDVSSDGWVSSWSFEICLEEGGLDCEFGGGGRGAMFASPMRSRVRASWAFVGIPRRSELGIHQQVFMCFAGSDILL